jgi:hypothetical protein
MDGRAQSNRCPENIARRRAARLKVGDMHSAETIERARALWRQGYSAAEIGRRMNVSKNVIIGIAHRNSFAPRPSPIKRFG